MMKKEVHKLKMLNGLVVKLREYVVKSIEIYDL